MLILVSLIVLYKPISKLTTSLVELHFKRKEWSFNSRFTPVTPTPHPRSDKLSKLVTLIESTGANAEKMAIECLLPLYVSNPEHWPEKLAIGDFVARHCLERPRAVILDTGTTVAAVAAQIMARAGWPDLVITNSVLTAIFISVTKSIHTRSVPKVYSPPGLVHAEYCGTYLLRTDLPRMDEQSLESLLENLKQVQVSLTKGNGTIYGIVAATYFSRRGPGANSVWNRQWKRDTCTLANPIIFCVDISKLGDHHGNQVFEKDEWEQMLRTKDVIIIIAGDPPAPARTEAHEELLELDALERKFSRLVIWRGEEKAGTWEFTSRKGVHRLPWSIPRQAATKNDYPATTDGGEM